MTTELQPGTQPEMPLGPPSAVYLAYRTLAGSAGALVLLTGDTRAAMALQAAGCRLAGAAVLMVTDDASAAKDAVRRGWCDFVVHSLDEALRILKMALRRKRPAGVVLQAASGPVLAECIERGVQPAFLDVPDAVLLHRGARLLRWAGLEPEESWVAWQGDASSAAQLRRMDAVAANALQSRREEKMHWLAQAPRELGRPWLWSRLLPLTGDERAALRRALATEPIEGMEVVAGLTLHGLQCSSDPAESRTR